MLTYKYQHITASKLAHMRNNQALLTSLYVRHDLFLVFLAEGKYTGRTKLHSKNHIKLRKQKKERKRKSENKLNRNERFLFSLNSLNVRNGNNERCTMFSHPLPLPKFDFPSASKTVNRIRPNSFGQPNEIVNFH